MDGLYLALGLACWAATALLVAGCGRLGGGR